MLYVQYTSPVHNTLCCMYSTGMLYEGGGKGVGHCPCTFIKEGGWWCEVLDTSVPSSEFFNFGDAHRL